MPAAPQDVAPHTRNPRRSGGGREGSQSTGVSGPMEIYIYARIYKMKKLSSKKKILQIRMLNKKIQKIKLRKNKRVKEEKKTAERDRKLPRNR